MNKDGRKFMVGTMIAMITSIVGLLIVRHKKTNA